MEEDGGSFELTVQSLSGDVLASFLVDSKTTAAEALSKLEAVAQPPCSFRYRLVGANGPLEPTAQLARAAASPDGAAPSLRLTALLDPVARLQLPKLSGAAQLPSSGDLVVATCGPLLEGAAPAAAVGKDDGPLSPMWLWRLKKSSGWSPATATLLARQLCWTQEELEQEFLIHIEHYGSSGQAYLPKYWTDEELQRAAAGEEGMPTPRLDLKMTFIHAHDDRYVLLAWNPENASGWVQRLDVETGEICALARAHDLWSAISDRDGRIFCSCCYAGWSIQLVRGVTVYDPPAEQETFDPNNHLIITGRCGPGFAYDAELGGLVVDARRLTPRSMYVLCEPGSEALARVTSWPGAEVVDMPVDEHTQGDRSSPWTAVRIAVGNLEKVETPAVEDHRNANDEEWASLFISSRGGQVCMLEPRQRLEVRSFQLSDAGTSEKLQIERVFSDSRMHAFAGTWGAEQPLVLLQSAA